MAKVDKHFLTGSSGTKYDFLEKDVNINNQIGYMLNRSLSMFHYINLPDTIPIKELELLLQTNGYGIFLEVEGNYYIVAGGLGGEPDVYNEPTQVNISIPYLKYNKTLDLDKDCILISNDTLRLGLLPIYNKYCNLLNETEITMVLGLYNKRIQYLISASDDNTVESAREYLKQVEEGKLGVIAENKLFDSLKINNNTNSNNPLRELIEFNQYIKATMFNEIGLQANVDMKRERMIQAEVISSNTNIYPLVDNMLEVRRKALEEINNKYDLDIQIEFSSSWEYRINQGESVNELETEVDTNIEPTPEPNIEPTDEPNIEQIVEPIIEPNKATGEEPDTPEDEPEEIELEKEVEEMEQEQETEETELVPEDVEPEEPEEVEPEDVEPEPEDEKK